MAEFLHTARHKNFHADYRQAKALRLTSSPAEQQLWGMLRKSARALGLKFRRQHPIKPYIVDFVCLKTKLIIELDGISHDTRQDHDNKRTQYLRNFGYEIVRFSNEDVYRDCEAVVQTILHKVQEQRDVDYAPLP